MVSIEAHECPAFHGVHHAGLVEARVAEGHQADAGHREALAHKGGGENAAFHLVESPQVAP